jgi:SAM-dependent methyltransferase
VKPLATLFDLFGKAKPREVDNASSLASAPSGQGLTRHATRQIVSESIGERDAVAARDIIKRLTLVTERFPREYDHMYRALLHMLRTLEREDGLARFMATWSAMVEDILSTPQWLELLFPDETAADPSLSAKARAARNNRYRLTDHDPTPVSGTEGFAPRSMFDRLLEELSTIDPASGPPFSFLSRYYFFRDILFGSFVDVSLRPVQRAIFHQCYLQRHNWQRSYAADYPYQGMERLGISGIKPAEERLARYDIAQHLGATDRVLDIGSNNGFWALVLATTVAHVDGLEFNPYLVAIANLAKEHLGAHNASFIPADFVDYETSQTYDIVCSLANHCTIDGNLSMDFEQYIAKVFSLLKPGGFLFFESHNVFGPGAGGAGDDGDLDAKFDIAERYFRVLKYKMTPAYVPAFDIDKLFIVMRRRDHYQSDAVRTLRLSEARNRYGY